MNTIFENATATWNDINGLKTYSLYNYYPKSVDLDNDPDALKIRELVYDFKGDRSFESHQNAVKAFMPPLCSVLNHFFGESLKDLTLVCIHASTQLAQNVRYGDFSEELCQRTGMTNTFDRFAIVQDGTPKHIYGHNAVKPKLTVKRDDGFFTGRNILIFDDIITRGETMLIYANNFRKMGANVVGGISLCRTTREYYPQKGNPCDTILSNAS